MLQPGVNILIRGKNSRNKIDYNKVLKSLKEKDVISLVKLWRVIETVACIFSYNFLSCKTDCSLIVKVSFMGDGGQGWEGERKTLHYFQIILIFTFLLLCLTSN